MSKTVRNEVHGEAAIRQVDVLELHPGDALVVQVDSNSDKQQVENVLQAMREGFPEHIIVVHAGNLQLEARPREWLAAWLLELLDADQRFAGAVFCEEKDAMVISWLRMEAERCKCTPTDVVRRMVAARLAALPMGDGDHGMLPLCLGEGEDDDGLAMRWLQALAQQNGCSPVETMRRLARYATLRMAPAVSQDNPMLSQTLAREGGQQWLYAVVHDQMDRLERVDPGWSMTSMFTPEHRLCIVMVDPRRQQHILPGVSEQEAVEVGEYSVLAARQVRLFVDAQMNRILAEAEDTRARQPEVQGRPGGGQP